MIRYPRPLAPGDTVGVTSPSAGVPDELSARLAVAVTAVEDRGFTVRVGDLMDGSGLTSGTADARGEELTALMTNGDVRAVVPPWGGATAIDLLPRLDWDALAADPTWLVGYSDVSTILLPLTLRTGVATLYGQNLMDTPYRVPSPLLSWLDVATAPAGSVLTQGSAPFHRLSGFDDYATHPAVAEYTLETPGGWRRLDGSGEVDVEGRLVGGCLETVSPLTGTPFGTSLPLPSSMRRRDSSSTSSRPGRTRPTSPGCSSACGTPGGSTTRTPCSWARRGARSSLTSRTTTQHGTRSETSASR